MKRAEVEHGVEYAVRRGSYGDFARILIEGEGERAKWGSYRHRGGTRTERCLVGRLLEGHYRIDYGDEKSTNGKVAVRARDVSHTWALELERRKDSADREAALAAELTADKAEREELSERMVALGVVWPGFALEPESYRYRGKSETLAVRREALRVLIEKAESERA